MLWSMLGGLLKGIGHSALTTGKAISFVRKELGKGALGMKSSSSPLALGEMGSAAGTVAQAGKVANSLGGVIGKMSGFPSKGSGTQNSQMAQQSQPIAAAPLGMQNAAPTAGTPSPLAFSTPEGQLELEMLRRRMYGVT